MQAFRLKRGGCCARLQVHVGYGPLRDAGQPRAWTGRAAWHQHRRHGLCQGAQLPGLCGLRQQRDRGCAWGGRRGEGQEGLGAHRAPHLSFSSLLCPLSYPDGYKYYDRHTIMGLPYTPRRLDGASLRARRMRARRPALPPPHRSALRCRAAGRSGLARSGMARATLRASRTPQSYRRSICRFVQTLSCRSLHVQNYKHRASMPMHVQSLSECGIVATGTATSVTRAARWVASHTLMPRLASRPPTPRRSTRSSTACRRTSCSVRQQLSILCCPPEPGLTAAWHRRHVDARALRLRRHDADQPHRRIL
eukprot:COSAG04_NODE_1152_length_8057_cov_5.794295_4_plen_308_part_00